MFGPGPCVVSTASTPTSVVRSTCRRASSSRASRSSSAAMASSVTAGLRDPYADELNYVFLDAGRGRRADPRGPRALRGRGPRPGHASLLALHAATSRCATPARRESTSSGGSREIGLDRIVCFPTRWSPTVDAQAAFAEDCRAAGLALDTGPVGATSLGRGAWPRRPADPADPAPRRVAEPGAPDEELERDRAVAARVDRLAEARPPRSPRRVASLTSQASSSASSR